MVRGTVLVLLFALLIFGPWYFLKSPFDAVYCLMSGNEWAAQGKNSRYCKEVFSDGGRLCLKNSDCMSKKCVIGMWDKLSGIDSGTQKVVEHEEISLGIFGNITNPYLRGKCSSTSQVPCNSGEITLDENRVVVTPSDCE